MSLSFDDKILGEKVDNYCSSSEGGEDSDESDGGEGHEAISGVAAPPLATDTLSHRVAQTGPKGVIADYKQYRKLKDEQEKLKSEVSLQVAKKCALTSRPYSADQSAKEEEQQLKEMLEGLMDDDDAFLAQYRQKRLAEMQGALKSLPIYARVYELNTGNFVSEIDKEPAEVTVIVHIYEEGNPACKSTNEAFECLCKAYPHSKFCKIRASTAFLSRNFVANGVPAILVYKNKEMIGNLISISKELDDYFPPEELETYLFEHGFLPLKEDNVSAVPEQSSKIRCASLDVDSD
ncbi:Phosducin-like protein [Echinococcus granulosus]|uniref:Phosducin protein n=1 Tax=Echinococcus granulosus TaxID=6210 RepID=U6J4D9_ECHGR|nr:Phosducin-like protein [Echinococcus granulosus]EUB64551.1 Phosducin-like protein [Echinococcus granulosus]KAH9285673.1 Phosducin-like protein [Echinococcus granulosus]CDS16593.1 phosducin protein [Echinococcus granulosus]